MGNTEVFVMGQKENQSFGEVVYEDPMTEIKLLFAATGIGVTGADHLQRSGDDLCRVFRFPK
jgi:hypothetical protein